MKPFKKYEKQHADIIALIQKESEVVGQIIQVISNPLDANAETSVNGLKEKIVAIKTLSEQSPEHKPCLECKFLCRPRTAGYFCLGAKKSIRQKWRSWPPTKIFFGRRTTRFIAMTEQNPTWDTRRRQRYRRAGRSRGFEKKFAHRAGQLMREAANLGFNNYHFDRTKKETAAKELNAQAQNDYIDFINRYDAAKRRLTNPNNL